VGRGEIRTTSANQSYAGKPRPVLIIQNDRLDADESTILCPLNADSADVPLRRITLQPCRTNGPIAPSSIVIDKITTAHKSKLGKHIG